jgi:hypothetical protein
VNLPGITLEVVRLAGGRIHLTPRVHAKGPVTTLCGRTLESGTYSRGAGDANCANCIRRSRDPSRVSGAFFAQDQGGELLRLSLEQARWLRPQRPGGQRTVTKPQLVPAVPRRKPEVVPERLGELVTRFFKPSGDGAWRSPGDAVVRMQRRGRQWRFAELAFDGAVVATRVGEGLRIRAGDVEVIPLGEGFEVRVSRP